jgi:predicted transcriptional regulator
MGCENIEPAGPYKCPPSIQIRQTLTAYVQRAIIHHLEMNEGITDFSNKIGINSGRIQAFLKGAGSFRLDTCDRILNYIESFKR